jgi:hypothetical protein
VHEVAMEKRQDEIRRQKLEDAEKFFGMKPREIKCAVSHDSGLEPLVRINAAWSLWRR